MAVTPFSESGLISVLRAKGISTSDIEDDALGTIIADALSEYLFYRPKLAITSGTTCITTVAGTANYAKPAGAVFIVDCFWNPGYSVEELDDVWTNILLGSVHDVDPTMIMLNHLKMAQYNRLFKGFWEMVGDEIRLKPTPDGVYKVGVLYATSRTLEELDQIGDRRFVDLVYYSAMLAVATKKLTGGGWKAGQFQVNESVGRETMRVAEKGLEKTRLVIANAFRASRS